MNRAYLSAAAAAALILSLAGCSGGAAPAPGGASAPTTSATRQSDTPLVDALMKKASSNMREAKSVRMKIDTVQDGAPMQIIYAGNAEGTNGTLKAGKEASSMVTMLLVEGKAYMLIDKAVEKASGQNQPIPAEMLGKYKVTDSKDLKAFVPKNMFAEITKEWDKTNLLTNLTNEVKPATFEGVNVWAVESRGGKADQKEKEHVYFSKDGKDEFVGLESTGDKAMKLALDQWNAVPAIAAPAAASIIEG